MSSSMLTPAHISSPSLIARTDCLGGAEDTAMLCVPSLYPPPLKDGPEAPTSPGEPSNGFLNRVSQVRFLPGAPESHADVLR
jgi:hypothetical protein